MLKKLIIPFALFTFVSLMYAQIVYAQLDNTVLEDRFSLQKEGYEQLFLEIRNFNYLRNNEYFNSIVSGETLFGYQLSPLLKYYPLPNLRIEAGVFLQQDFGREGYSYTNVTPVFSLFYKKDSSSIIFGNLQANYAHRLIEPLYAFERGIIDRLESGLQLINHRKRWYGEFWVDWQDIISENRDRPEQISAGLVSRLALIQKSHSNLEWITQFTLRHIGGQDLVVPVDQGNLINLATGLGAQWKINPEGFLRSIRSENYWLLYSESSDNPQIDGLNGQAFYANLEAETKYLRLMLSLWLGQEYNSAFGGDLYKSYSQNNSGQIEENRSLLFFRFYKDFNAGDNFNISLRLEPYLDLNNQLFEYSFGFYITFRPDILLVNFGKD